MDPRIILSGQPVNVLGSLAAGTEAAGMTNAVHRQNALADLYREQGAGILAGDQGSLNALSGLDPMKALEVQATRQSMDVQMQQLEVAKQGAAMRMQEFAQKLSADQAAQQLKLVTQGMNAAMMARTPEEWNAILQQYGLDPAQAPFEQRDIVLASVLGAKDVLEMRAKMAGDQPTFRPATPAEAARYGATAGQFDDATGRFYPNNPPTGMSIQSDGQGGFTMIQGPGVTEKPLPVEQGKNAGFLLRAEESEKIMSALQDEGTSLGGRFLEAIPLGLGNYMQTPEYRQFEQARRDFVNAILRRESGAVISPAEFANAEKQYFPVPGDDPRTIEQKRRNRQTAIAGLRIGSGPGAAQVDALREEQGSGGDEAPTQPPQSFLDRPDVKQAMEVGVDPMAIWEQLSDDVRRGYQ